MERFAFVAEPRLGEAEETPQTGILRVFFERLLDRVACLAVGLLRPALVTESPGLGSKETGGLQADSGGRRYPFGGVGERGQRLGGTASQPRGLEAQRERQRLFGSPWRHVCQCL